MLFLKKIIFLVSLGVFSLFSGSQMANANEIVSSTSIQNVEIVDFDSLDEEAVQHFKDEGFNENDEYYTETIIQTPQDVNGKQARAAINVITLTASTKKVTNTQGYTSYIITATQAPFVSIDFSLSIGSVKTVSSSVRPYKGTYGYSGGIFANYTGKRGYQSFRLRAQYLTTWGAGSTSCSAGGLTIGK